MSKIIWDAIDQRFYETGVDHGVLYPCTNPGVYGKGVPWNGLTAVNEKPSGAEATKLYADNIKYLTLLSAEEYAGTIEAYYYPDEFEACDGTGSLAAGVTIGQQTRKAFGLSYRSKIGNGDDQEFGYKLHLIYGAKASPSERNHQTVNDSPEATTLSWEFDTTPVEIPGFKPSAYINFDSTKVDPEIMQRIEAILYGSEDTEPRLPMPAEIIEILSGSVVITTAAESPTANLLGMQVSDLQSNIVVGANSITGSLKHVTGYTGFSSKTAEQEGHYLALKIDTDPNDVVTTVELIGGNKGPVTLDADKNIVLLIKNTATQSVKVTSTKDGVSISKTYSLTGLVLEP